MRTLKTTVAVLALLAAGVGESQAYSFGTVSDGPHVGLETSSGTSFDDLFTFDTTRPFNINLTLLTSFTTPGTLSGVVYSLFKGDPMGTHTFVGGLAPTITNMPGLSGAATATGSFMNLAKGDYYFELKGNASTTSTIINSTTFSVSSVPLPASFPMFGAALLGLAGVAWVRRRKDVESQGVAAA